MIPLHALVLILMGRFTNRLYIAYSSWYAVGTLASMQVPFVGFQPVRTSEHMGALGTQLIGVMRITSCSHDTRRIRSFAAGGVYRPCPLARWIEAVPVVAQICTRGRELSWCRTLWSPHFEWLDRTMDWAILFTLGYRICQEVGFFLLIMCIVLFTM